MSPFRHEKDVSGTRRQVDPYLSLGSFVGPHKSDAGSLVDPDLGRKIANNERKSPAEDGIPDGSSLFEPRPPSPLGGNVPDTICMAVCGGGGALASDRIK